MNKRFFITAVTVLIAYVLSACGGLPQQTDQSSGEQAAIKVRAVEVAYTGVIDAINGSEWTVNGQLLTVDPAVVQDGPFQVGDTIKIEGEVNQDGSIIVLRVELPSAADLTDLPQLGNDTANDNANSNDDNSNDDNANSNDDNSNDDNANDNGNDNDDDDNANGNSNDSDEDDDGNSNGNNIDDDDDDDGSSGNSNGSENGGSSNDSHDDDGGSNSNGSDDDND